MPNEAAGRVESMWPRPGREATLMSVRPSDQGLLGSVSGKAWIEWERQVWGPACMLGGRERGEDQTTQQEKRSSVRSADWLRVQGTAGLSQPAGAP